MKFVISLFLILTGLIAGAQQPGMPDDFDYGKVEDTVYKNQYFGFTLPVPATWYNRTKEEMKQGMERGLKRIGEGNKELEPAIKVSQVRTAPLLGVFRYRPDSAVGQFNYSFALVAENLTSITGINSGSAYLGYVEKAMKQSNLSIRIIESKGEQEFGGKKFDLMKIDMTMQGITVHQVYYVAIIRNFATAIIITFINEQQEKELAGILKELRFVNN